MQRNVKETHKCHVFELINGDNTFTNLPKLPMGDLDAMNFPK